jgi:hypothetical protein
MRRATSVEFGDGRYPGSVVALNVVVAFAFGDCGDLGAVFGEEVVQRRLDWIVFISRKIPNFEHLAQIADGPLARAALACRGELWVDY